MNPILTPRMKQPQTPNLVRGTITITATPTNIKIEYYENSSRNGILHPIVAGLDLNIIQRQELEQKILDEQNKLQRGRRRYSQLILQEEAWNDL